MENKKFGVERQGNKSGQENKILTIKNDNATFVRVDESKRGTPFSDYLHRQEKVASEKEVKSYESLREEICETFGVPIDSDHIWIRELENPSSVEKPRQRKFRVFCALLNTQENEGFYGEGRMRHADIFNQLASIAHKKGMDIGAEFKSLMGSLETGEFKTENGWMWVKGFMSNDNFSDLPERFRSKREKLVVDDNGDKYETPESWFVSGGSIAS
jgi:hypothetical protein